MKNLDTFSKRFISVSLSVMGVLLCASVFMFSIGPATANEESTSFDFPEEFRKAPASPGTIMMDYTSVHVPSQDKTYYEVMVWDTQTGESKLYYYNYTDKKFKAYEDNVQIPANPLGR